MGRYDDILSFPHPEPEGRARMSMHDRAGQFSPYAALVGYGDAVEETGRYTAAEKALCEDEKELLDRRLKWVSAHIREHPTVEITWFVPDGRKDGGEYVTAVGKVQRLDRENCVLVLEDGTRAELMRTVKLSFPGESESTSAIIPGAASPHEPR